MTKKTLLIAIFSAIFMLVQGGNPITGLPNFKIVGTAGVSPFIRQSRCNDSINYIRNDAQSDQSRIKTEQLSEEIPPLIISKPKQVESDTIAKDNKLLDLSKLGSIEYLINWINLLLKMT